ncbi:putative spore maturation protein A [Firmicutes bacterium CAG:170]|jgi:spore maturation protein A|nr:putative spore maturation protein A [Firmicutes bacterium CAG:170]
MLLSYVWIIMVILSIFCSILTGRTAQTGSAALIGAQNGVTLALSLCGSLCLWSGFAKLTEKSGLARRFSALLRPLLSRLFPEASRDPSALQDLCGNLTANFLGLGNAATPMGISAVRRMHALSGKPDASDEMCRLIVLNTASIQLIPSTVGAVRASLGSARPFDILPAVWLTSACSVTAGLLAARLFSRRWRA